MPWKGVENRARRKAMKAAIDAMPPFRRVTGPSTRQHVKATLRAALNDAIAQQIITFNPAAHVEIDPVRKPKALVWTDERVAQVAADRREALARHGLDAGADRRLPRLRRRGPAVRHVAPDRLPRPASGRGVRAALVGDQPRHATPSPSPPNSSRTAGTSRRPTPRRTAATASSPSTTTRSSVLKRHRERQDADREEWGSAWVDTGLVFTQEDGSWLHPGKVTDLFERLVAASGLPPIRLHDLRHGAATLMLAAGIDVKIVSDTLGHSDTRITRDIYQSVLPQVGKSAAEATAKLVPLQRKTEAEKAARKAAKGAKKATEEGESPGQERRRRASAKKPKK